MDCLQNSLVTQPLSFIQIRAGSTNMSKYQRLLSEHDITQSMSRKGNCLGNGVMENFFSRLKVEMFYGEKFESVSAFIEQLKHYIDYYNNDRISLKLKGMSPVQYRTHFSTI